MFIDKPATEDILNREDLATRVARGIYLTSRQETDGFVVGITGKWGSGKSTLLGFVKKHLEASFPEKNASCFLEFNPWMFSEEQDIQKAFLKHFLQGIRPVVKQRKKIAHWFVSVGKLLSKLDFISASKADVSRDLIDLFKSYIDNDNTLYYKKLIDKKLESENRKIFVFIDDMDRLMPRQVFEIFQVLKLTGNFKNTFYVVAFDREAVEISIESQFSNYGDKFLDKIIQADFCIPEVPEEKIEQLFFYHLQILCTNLSISYDSSELSSVWLHRGLKHYFRTLRDIYRYLNSIQFSLPHIASEVNIADFLVLEAVRLNNFKVYGLIYKDTGRSIKNYESSRGTAEIASSSDLLTSSILQYLFDASAKDSRNAKRLKDPKYFDRYFTLQISEKDISEKELQAFFESHTKKEVLEKSLAFGRFDNLMLRLNDRQLLEFYNDWDFELIRDLYNFLDEKVFQLEKKMHQYTDALVNMMSVRESHRNEYFNQFIDLLYYTGSGLSRLKIYFLHFMVLDKIHNTGFSANSHYFKEFYLKKHQAIQKNYVDYLKQWKNHFISPPMDNPESYYTTLFIYDYAHYFKEDYLKEIPQLLTSDKCVIFYLKNVVFINDGDRQAKYLESDKIERYLPGDLFDQFLKKIETMDMTILNTLHRQWREFILLNTEAKNQGL